MNLVHFMDEDKTMEFNVIQPKENKPIKVVIKELPRCTKPQDIVTDLEELGYTPAEATPPQPPKPRTQHKAHSVPDMEWTSLTRFQSPEKCKRSMLAKNFKKYFLDEDSLVASYEWIRDLFQDTLQKGSQLPKKKSS
ncbi:hypothetical protein TNCV_602191 [Trichonephila clavipes]|nr:hypothetical protein TNCV_602191 [Trichonephila clavipes]